MDIEGDQLLTIKMNKKNEFLFHKLLPRFIRTSLDENKIKRTIFSYYNGLPKSSVNEEEKAALRYLRNNRLCVFPYPFQRKYKRKDILVFEDAELKLRYVLTDGKRLYFRRSSSAKDIQRDYNYLSIEQDIDSPHRYLTEKFNLENDDVLVDVGAAEGNLPLSVIERVKKVYLFETDENWIEALKATFSPWKDKVEIVNKFVSDKNVGNNVSLDVFFKDKEKFTFLKVDAEGAESDILKGSEMLFSSIPKLKIAWCCYHKPNDDKTFNELFLKKGFSTSFSQGYMIFREPSAFTPPYLRRGVLRAEKK